MIGGRAIAATVLMCFAVACADSSAPSGTGAPAVLPEPAPSSSSPAPVSSSPPPAPSPSTLPTSTSATLRRGAHGAAVVALQQQLNEQGFWLGPVDGVFGDTTEQAVFAVQKSAGLDRDGVVGPRTKAALRTGARPTARSRQGHVIEVDLETDLLLLVTDGHVDTVLNTSTGGGYTYYSRGVAAVAVTPRGRFRVIRQVDGLVISPLGKLWRPKYFYAGFAVHGYPEVPPVPVSHGCVRLSNAAIDSIWADNLAPVGTPVWVY